MEEKHLVVLLCLVDLEAVEVQQVVLQQKVVVIHPLRLPLKEIMVELVVVELTELMLLVVVVEQEKDMLLVLHHHFLVVVEVLEVIELQDLDQAHYKEQHKF